MQVQGQKTYAGFENSTAYQYFHGNNCLDFHLLKQGCLHVPPEQLNVLCADGMQPAPVLLPFCKSNPILLWLPQNWTVWC